MVTSVKARLGRPVGRWHYLVIVLFIFLLYLPNLGSDWMIGDDWDQIVHHPYIGDWSQLAKLWQGSTYFDQANSTQFGLFYRPLMLTWFSILAGLFEVNPAIFRLSSLILFLSYICLSAWLAYTWTKNHGVSLATLIYLGLHPIMVEVVVHTASTQELLLLNLSLILLLWIKFGRFRNSQSWLELGLLSFLILSSKETGILVLSLAFGYLSQKTSFRLKNISAIVVAILTYLALRWQAIGLAITRPEISRFVDLSLSQRLELVWISLGYQWQSWIRPIWLGLHQTWLPNELTATEYWYFGIFAGLGLFLYGYLVAKSIKAKVWWVAVWLSSLMVLSIWHSHLILPLYLTTADRWSALSLTVLVLGVGYWWRQQSLQFWSGLMVIISLVYLPITTFQLQLWRQPELLLEHQAEVVPKSFYTQNLLASQLMYAGEYDQAAIWVWRSVATHPYIGNLTNAAIVLAREDQPEASRGYFESALTKQPISSVVENYANVELFIARDIEQARQLATEYLKTYPNSSRLWLVLAVASALDGDTQTAKLAATKAQDLQPTGLARWLLTRLDQEDNISWTELEPLLQ